MSRYNYGSLQETAARLINKFGAEYIFEKKTQTSYNPETGKPLDKTRNYKANAVVVDFTDAERSSEAVLQGDIRLLAESANYEVGDTVVYNCENYRIQNISTIQGSQQRLAYYLQLRK
jgi:hypothetical protein